MPVPPIASVWDDTPSSRVPHYLCSCDITPATKGECEGWTPGPLRGNGTPWISIWLVEREKPGFGLSGLFAEVRTSPDL